MQGERVGEGGELAGHPKCKLGRFVGSSRRQHNLIKWLNASMTIRACKAGRARESWQGQETEMETETELKLWHGADREKNGKYMLHAALSRVVHEHTSAIRRSPAQVPCKKVGNNRK